MMLLRGMPRHNILYAPDRGNCAKAQTHPSDIGHVPGDPGSDSAPSPKSINYANLGIPLIRLT